MTSSTLKNNKHNNNKKDKNIENITISQRINRETHHKSYTTDIIPRQMISCNKDITNPINKKPTQNCYQVATPKSPHDLMTLRNNDDLNVDNFKYQEMIEKTTSNSPGSFSNLPNSKDDTINTNNVNNREETERFKYNITKSEILDIVHLHSLLTHKEVDNIRNDIQRIEAQIKLLEHMHKDKTLPVKIENYELEKTEINKNILRAKSIQEKWKDHIFPNGSAPQNYLMTGSIHIPKHHYQTRSKSHGNLLDNTELFQPNDYSALSEKSNKRQKLSSDNAGQQTKPMVSFNNIPNSQDVQPHKDNKFELHKFTPNKMNAHHRRTYSSSCLSNNSGIIGHTEKNQPIFRRYDGILVIITCSFCKRDNFTSAQGIVNHTRLKHHKTYSSQPLTILFNQVLLPDEKQDPEILKKFETLKLDPHKEYLPYDIAIPTMTASPGKGRSKMTGTSSTSMKNKINEVNIMDQPKRDTTHLRSLYPNNDFDELVDMIDNSKKDLQSILDVPTDSDSEIDEEIDKDDLSKDEDFCMDDGAGKSNTDESGSSDYASEEDEREGTTSTISSPIEPYIQNEQPQRKTRMRNAKTKSANETNIETVGSRLRSRTLPCSMVEDIPNDNVSRRLRNADVEHVNNNDETEGTMDDSSKERSQHYNLRLRSKIRQTVR